MAKAKYTVEAFNSGNGFFIGGGMLGDTFVKDKADAEIIVAALNVAETLKLKSTLHKVSNLMQSLEAIENQLTKPQNY